MDSGEREKGKNQNLPEILSEHHSCDPSREEIQNRSIWLSNPCFAETERYHFGTFSKKYIFKQQLQQQKKKKNTQIYLTYLLYRF